MSGRQRGPEPERSQVVRHPAQPVAPPHDGFLLPAAQPRNGSDEAAGLSTRSDGVAGAAAPEGLEKDAAVAVLGRANTLGGGPG